MKKYKISTPNKGFNGERLGCKFNNGEHICECQNEQKIQEFRNFGYKVEEIKEPKKEAPKQKPKKTENKETE